MPKCEHGALAILHTDTATYLPQAHLGKKGTFKQVLLTKVPTCLQVATIPKKLLFTMSMSFPMPYLKLTPTTSDSNVLSVVSLPSLSSEPSTFSSFPPSSVSADVESRGLCEFWSHEMGPAQMESLFGRRKVRTTNRGNFRGGLFFLVMGPIQQKIIRPTICSKNYYLKTRSNIHSSILSKWDLFITGISLLIKQDKKHLKILLIYTELRQFHLLRPISVENGNFKWMFKQIFWRIFFLLNRGPAFLAFLLLLLISHFAIRKQEEELHKQTGNIKQERGEFPMGHCRRKNKMAKGFRKVEQYRVGQ